MLFRFDYTLFFRAKMAPPAQKDGKGGGSKRGNVNMQISISKRKAKCIRFHFECVSPPPNLPNPPPPLKFYTKRNGE